MLYPHHSVVGNYIYCGLNGSELVCLTIIYSLIHLSRKTEVTYKPLIIYSLLVRRGKNFREKQFEKKGFTNNWINL